MYSTESLFLTRNTKLFAKIGARIVGGAWAEKYAVSGEKHNEKHNVSVSDYNRNTISPFLTRNRRSSL